MPPHHGLVHAKEYDVKDSNVELIGTDVDHGVKHKSAATEPAWHDAAVGTKPGLRVWRIEQFQVVPWPEERYGQFYDGDSFIVLHSYTVGKASAKLAHDIFFWLGNHTTQDEAGTAAYKTVELDEFLSGAATQHREVQSAPSDEFLSLFPRLTIRSGGARTGFRHVEEPQRARAPVRTLLRVFKSPCTSASASASGPDGVVVHEVEPAVGSLDDGDVFVLDVGDKIWVWQGRRCSPVEKAKAAQVVHDMTLAKHVDVEVVAQAESRSRRVTDLLGGGDDTPRDGFRQPRPMGTASWAGEPADRWTRLFRLSDASGQLTFELVRDGGGVSLGDLDGNDVFLLDDGGRGVWVWEGAGASRREKASWLSVAQAYIRRLQSGDPDAAHHLVPLAKVRQGSESRAFLRAIAAC